VTPTSFIPGFAEQLIGASTGEKRTVNVDFPADFVTPELAGKKAIYEVEIVEVREKLLPEINDDFARSYGAEDLEKLREGVRNDLQNELDFKQQSDMRNQAVRELLNRVNFDLPESYVTQETRNVIYNVVKENQQRGIPSEVIDQQKDRIFSAANNTAKDRVKALFLFHKIADKEGITVEQQELLRRIQTLAMKYEMAPDKFLKELQKRNGIPEVHEQLISEKVVDLLVKNATVEEVEPQPKPEAPAG
jgi:trigger factor